MKLMQMRYVGHREEQLIMQWPPVPVPGSRCTAETHELSFLPRSACDGMMNDRQEGEHREMQPGQVWHEEGNHRDVRA